MTSLKTKLIRLAWTEPSLRPHLLPLLRTARAKGIEDLPGDWYVLEERSPVTAKFIILDEKPPYRDYGRIEIFKNSYCGDAWSVTYSGARSGWGPLLYDLAMEHAGEDGLIPDRKSITPDASRVWEYYFHHRSDVIKSNFSDTPRLERCPKWEVDHLDAVYIKKGRPLLTALKASGKLTNRRRTLPD